MSDEPIGYPDDMEEPSIEALIDDPNIVDDDWWATVLGEDDFVELSEMDPTKVAVQLVVNWRIDRAVQFIKVVETLLEGPPEEEDAVEEFLRAGQYASTLLTQQAQGLHMLVADAGFDPHTGNLLDEDGIPSCQKEAADDDEG